MQTDIYGIPCLFGLPRAESAELLTRGHINTTYLVGICGKRYILQSVNTAVFRDLKLLADNITRASAAVNRSGRISAPVYLHTEQGFGGCGGIWRMWEYIAAQRQPTPYETGYIYGCTINALDGVKSFHCAVEGFHDTRNIMSRMRKHGTETFFSDADTAAFADVPLRNIHADAKTDNCIVSVSGGLAVIDLDTVMTHYAAYDYGDMVRSVCRQDFGDLRALTEGFAAGLDGVLSDKETESLYSGVIYVTGELAVRYMRAADGAEDLGKAPHECLVRADELIRQLALFRQNEDYIRDTVRKVFSDV